MKKLLVLASLILSISLVSCSNDDDGGQDPIIGTWELESISFEGQEFPLEECEGETTVQFKSNGEVIATDYMLNENDECEVDTISEGTWELTQGTTYQTTFAGETTTTEVIFSNNNNKFTIEEDGFSSTFAKQ
ncbi:lipocalin family protein [Mesonia sp. K7]|uniref:lipocalin family protein n=1 Tax=Mesonia sp. K7 TaxID=2218606 RepID=UPI000DAA8521|nr:lipocalin family protein [Mesonia sp. K7]PZD79024.1 hypothetical protein DNG35_03180 [Mesonia sp. K7]